MKQSDFIQIQLNSHQNLFNSVFNIANWKPTKISAYERFIFRELRRLRPNKDSVGAYLTFHLFYFYFKNC